MRWLKGSLVLLTLMSISPAASALQVRICVPTCEADPGLTLTSQAIHTVTVFDAGLSTTTFPLGSVTRGRFTISGTVTAQQSGTLQKIVFNPTTITGTGCNTLATNPCKLQIIATSDVVDFPFDKPVGGYPAGIFMAGAFSAAQPRHQIPPNPNGDSISMTGTAGSIGELSTDYVINATPGSSVGDTPTSLPTSCSGTAGCKFIATSGLTSFNDQMQETIQQLCDGDSTACKTRLTTTVNVELKRAGNVTLPGGMVTVTPARDDEEARNQTAILLAETLPPMGDFNAQKLLVGRNNFALTARLQLASGGNINPAAEEVYVRAGNFSMTIAEGRFKRLLDGKLFAFLGKVAGMEVAATLVRDHTDPSAWTFIVGVHDVQLRPLLPMLPAQTPVDVSVGGDTGSDLVTPIFF